jgi:mono/diheme cytochrome c family protein
MGRRSDNDGSIVEQVPTALFARSVIVVALTGFTILGASCTTRDPEGIAAATTPEGERGRQVAIDQGCANCHRTDGSESLGPAWDGQWGSTVELDGGGSATYDEEYVRTAIVDPDAQRRDGWGNRRMAQFSNLSDEQIAELTAYIRELSPGAEADTGG